MHLTAVMWRPADANSQSFAMENDCRLAGQNIRGIRKAAQSAIHSTFIAIAGQCIQFRLESQAQTVRHEDLLSERGQTNFLLLEEV